MSSERLVIVENDTAAGQIVTPAAKLGGTFDAFATQCANEGQTLSFHIGLDGDTVRLAL